MKLTPEQQAHYEAVAEMFRERQEAIEDPPLPRIDVLEAKVHEHEMILQQLTGD